MLAIVEQVEFSNVATNLKIVGIFLIKLNVHI